MRWRPAPPLAKPAETINQTVNSYLPERIAETNCTPSFGDGEAPPAPLYVSYSTDMGGLATETVGHAMAADSSFGETCRNYQPNH
jgi:hypothetical protein